MRPRCLTDETKTRPRCSEKRLEAETLATKATSLTHGWLGGSVVERQSLTGELSLVCTGSAADV